MEIDKGRGVPAPLEIAPAALDDMDVDFVAGRSSAASNPRRHLSDTAPNLKIKLDELFHYWLARHDTAKLLEQLIADAEAGRDLKPAGDLAANLAPPGSARASSPSALASATPAFLSGSVSSPSSNPSTSPHSIASSPKSPVSRFISAHISFNSPASPLLKGRSSPNHEMIPGGSNISLEPSIALTAAPSAFTATPTQATSDGQPKETSASAVKPPFPPAISTQPSLSTAKVGSIPPFYFPVSKCTAVQDACEREVISTYFSNRRASNIASANVTPRKGDQQQEQLTDQADAANASRPSIRSDIAELVVEAIGLPSFFSGVIYDRITARSKQGLPGEQSPKSQDEGDAKEGQTAEPPLTEAMFMEYFNEHFAGWSRPKRLFLALLNGVERDHVTSADFQPLVDALLVCHPGLAFLQATPEFQQRYAETVIERIFYRCARRCDSKLYLADVVRSKLLETLMQVDEEEDLNRERKFFSYEHFYVLYCRFWELDQDHDLLINRDDLLRYGGHSLTFRVVDRIFEGCGRPLDCKGEGFMSYTDFIWFCLSEEDKTSETAIDYWFRCVDLDGDGLVTMYDIEHFYTEQLHRMECLGHEPVQLEDILCQLLDMINPNLQPPQIRRSALRQCRLASNFFNVLFNLNKFFSLESRDPLQIRQEHATPELSDWDRFATIEYLRLSAEEEGEEEMEDGWDELDENRMLELQEPQF